MKKPELHLGPDHLKIELRLLRDYPCRFLFQQEGKTFHQLIMSFHPIKNRLPAGIQGFGNLLCLHAFGQITDQDPVCLSGLFLFTALQPLKSRPLVFDPLGVHIFRTRANHNHGLC